MTTKPTNKIDLFLHLLGQRNPEDATALKGWLADPVRFGHTFIADRINAAATVEKFRDRNGNPFSIGERAVREWRKRNEREIV